MAQVASLVAAQLSLELAQSFNYVCILMAVLALYAIKRPFKGGWNCRPLSPPIVPLILVLSFKLEIIPAFLCPASHLVCLQPGAKILLIN